jgi:hypothetical protein
VATVTLNVTQSGSGSTVIHAQIGDTITIELNETVFSNVLDQAAAQINSILGPVTGVTFAFDNSGDATNKVEFLQSGSGSTSFTAQAGDTVTFMLNETVFSNVLDQAADQLNSILGPVTGVTFAFSNSGGAS